MAGNGMFTGSEQRVMIRDAYLADTSNGDIDLLTLTPSTAFIGLNTSQGRGIPKSGVNSAYNPMAISVNTAGRINGRGKNDPYRLSQQFTAGELHRVGLRTIRPSGTTARGIIVHS
jgi:hypothetical protein